MDFVRPSYETIADAQRKRTQILEVKLAELEAANAEKNVEGAELEAELAAKNAKIMSLKAQLKSLNNK